MREQLLLVFTTITGKMGFKVKKRQLSDQLIKVVALSVASNIILISYLESHGFLNRFSEWKSDIFNVVKATYLKKYLFYR